MPQTKAGGQKVRETNYNRHGKDYYQRIGAMGGRKSSGPDYQKGGAKATGFAKYPELAREAGRKGGTISKRRPSVRRAKTAIPTLAVSMDEQIQLTELARALQAEASVVS